MEKTKCVDKPSLECLDRVNQIRAIHEVGPLTWNEKLEAEAQAWAEKLAEKDALEHSPKDSRIHGKGENLFGFSGLQPLVTAIDQWYKEEKEYDFRQNKFVGNAGNFTQLVWSDTKQMGLGSAKSNTGWTYICARFNPGGNTIISPPGEEECMKNNVKKAKRKELQILRKQMEKLEFHDTTIEEEESFIAEINRIREEHQVQALEESQELRKGAAQWAKKLAAQDKPESGHVDGVGECLFCYTGPNFQLNAAINAWYGGKEKYDFNKPGFNPGCGNFTQLVWADSKQIGMAAAKANSGKIYVVARFKPSGNVVMTPPGEKATFNKNVFVRKRQ